MSVELNCWQSFWNWICCGNCYSKAEESVRRPLLQREQQQATDLNGSSPPPRGHTGRSIQHLEVEHSYQNPTPVRRDFRESNRVSPTSSPERRTPVASPGRDTYNTGGTVDWQKAAKEHKSPGKSDDSF